MTDTAISSRPPLERMKPRLIGGVCAGTAEHLGLPVGWIRLATVGLTALFGLGAVAYLTLWALMPTAKRREDPRGSPSGAASPRPGQTPSTAAPRGARPLIARTDHRSSRYGVVAGVLIATVFGVSIIGGLTFGPAAWAMAGVLALIGASLAWGQIARTQRWRTHSLADVQPAAGGEPVWFVVVAGWTIAVLAFVAVLARDRPVADALWALFAGTVLLAVTALILLPVGVRLWRDLGSERAARAREAERADIAAHLHDSVLQTLALIRARSHDRHAVTSLARSQERELRQWLYSSRGGT